MFYSILNSLCQNKGITVTNLLKLLGLSTSRGTAWKNGINPNADVLILIADYFNVSVDYLLGRTDIAELGGRSELREPERRLLEYFRQLSQIEQGELIGEAKQIVKNHKEEIEKENA